MPLVSRNGRSPNVTAESISYLHQWLFNGDAVDTGTSEDLQDGVGTAGCEFVDDGEGGTCLHVPAGHEMVITRPSDFAFSNSYSNYELSFDAMVENTAIADFHGIPFALAGTTWTNFREHRLVLRTPTYTSKPSWERGGSSPTYSTGPEVRDGVWRTYKVLKGSYGSFFQSVMLVDDLPMDVSVVASNPDTSLPIRVGMAGETNLGSVYVRNLRYRLIGE